MVRRSGRPPRRRPAAAFGEPRGEPGHPERDSLATTIRAERQVLVVRWIGIAVGAAFGPLLVHGVQLLGLWAICAAAALYCLAVEVLLLRRRSRLLRQGHVMILGDLLLAGVVVAVTGGVRSEFYLVYFPLMILSAVRFGGRSTLISAGIAMTSYLGAVGLGGLPAGLGAWGSMCIRLGFLLMTSVFAAFVTDRGREAEHRLVDAYDATLAALSRALDERDVETEGHSRRVTAYALRLGVEAGMDDEALVQLARGAMMHDIGKIGVPDQILRKPGPLTADEWAIMRRHPGLGAHILSAVPSLTDALSVVLQHHERWDGGGYPDGLRGEDIDLAARVFAIVDAYDAMTSDRPYRRARPHEEAVAEIQGCAGTQFDPVLVELFAALSAAEWDAAAARARPSISPPSSLIGAIRSVAGGRRGRERHRA